VKSVAYRVWPESLCTGLTSVGSSASVCRVKSSGTCQTKTCEQERVSGGIGKRQAETRYLAIVGTRSDDRVVERVPANGRQGGVGSESGVILGAPVGVEDGGRVATEQGHDIGELATLIDRNDSKGAATAGLPIDRQVLGVGLDQVGVPGILGDAEVVVTLLLRRDGASGRDPDGNEAWVGAYLLGRLPEDVSCLVLDMSCARDGRLQALTVL
jgi:hypothetical protein